MSQQLQIPTSVKPYLEQTQLPDPQSHKGQNGKLLIIGGSGLFHAASRWSLDIASKFVDMVFYASVPENNRLIKQAKQNFWNGIVVPRHQVREYLTEADAVLIGPGMERKPCTQQLTRNLLSEYPGKKWVIDAGALQMLEPKLLGPTHIITPHQRELQRLMTAGQDLLGKPAQPSKLANERETSSKDRQQLLMKLRQQWCNCTILLKGPIDFVATSNDVVKIEGGNAGMTKGGTGDVLAGLVAGLYATHQASTSAVVGSYINKLAGNNLYRQVGPYFNASDLVQAIPKAMWRMVKAIGK